MTTKTLVCWAVVLLMFIGETFASIVSPCVMPSAAASVKESTQQMLVHANKKTTINSTEAMPCHQSSSASQPLTSTQTAPNELTTTTTAPSNQANSAGCCDNQCTCQMAACASLILITEPPHLWLISQHLSPLNTISNNVLPKHPSLLYRPPISA